MRPNPDHSYLLLKSQSAKSKYTFKQCQGPRNQNVWKASVICRYAKEIIEKWWWVAETDKLKTLQTVSKKLF